MSNEDWANEVFRDEDKKRERDRLNRKRNEEEREERKPVEEEPKKEVVVEKSTFWSRLKKMFRAAKDVDTVDTSEPPTDSLSENVVSGVVTGTDVIYIVPTTMRKLRVRILESNGRLKNQYTLTDYLSIAPGDKFHIIVDE